MKNLDLITIILLVVGGLNWGLVGLFDFNLVATIFGAGSWLSRIVYIAVAFCGVYQLFGRKAISERVAASA